MEQCPCGCVGHANAVYRLASESPVLYNEDSDSVHSVQGYETTCAQDTPDTDTKSESEDVFNIEYELEDLSSDEANPFIEDDSSSGSDNILAAAGAAIAAAICDKSLETWLTDGEDSNNTTVDDSEVACTYFWKCVQCNSANSDSKYRYCQKCFQARKTLFPPRSKARKRRKRVPEAAGRKFTHQLVSSQDSGLGSQDSRPTKRRKSVDNAAEKPAASGLPETMELCDICHVAFKDSIFLHGRIGHMFSCYKCSMRIWRTRKRCPVCNCLVKNVVKIFK